MSNQQQNTNANTAHPIVAGPEARTLVASADLDAAWEEWSTRVQQATDWDMALLRAVFEAGWNAARATSSASV